MKPLPIKVKLAPYKGEVPKYKVSITSKKGTPFKVSDPRVQRLSLALMDMQAVMGGAASHWGGPSAFAEIVSALYAVVFHISLKKNTPWHQLFHLVNDAGHCENGLYALRANYGWGGMSFENLKGFRSLGSPLAGHGEAHLFPEGVYLSNGPLGSTLAQAQGLAMADRMQNRNRSTLVLISDGACMEGEVKEALTSIPGLSGKGQMNPLMVLVSDNNTKLSGRIEEDSFSMNPFFNSLGEMGWNTLTLSNGHDLKACVDLWESLLDRESSGAGGFKPVFIRAKTRKGYGLKSTEEARAGGHGFPLKDPRHLPEILKELSQGRPLPQEFLDWQTELINSASSPPQKAVQRSPQPQQKKPQKVKVQQGVSRALIQARKKGLPVVSVSADLQGSTGVGEFRKAFPEVSFDLGVAEANMISVAAGFSKQGFIPVVDTFAQFGVTKGALPLFMAGLSEAPVIAFFSHTGFQDAADGASHQTLSYMAAVCALPSLKVYSLTTAEEAFHLVGQAVENFASLRRRGQVPPTSVFFMGREVFAPSYLPRDYPYQLGKAQVLFSDLLPQRRQGVLLLASGPLVEEALKAAPLLRDKSWNVMVVNPSLINEPDTELLKQALQKTGYRLLTLEDHHQSGGMGQMVAHHLLCEGVRFQMHSLSVKAAFGRSAYRSHHLYESQKLTAPHVVKAVLEKWPLPSS